MSIYNNIFYRRYKSYPISYYKRGKELISFVSVSDTGSLSLNLKNTEYLHFNIDTAGNAVGQKNLNYSDFISEKSFSTSKVENISLNKELLNKANNNLNLSVGLTDEPSSNKQLFNKSKIN